MNQKHIFLPVAVLLSLSLLTACTAESRRSSTSELSSTSIATNDTRNSTTTTSNTIEKTATYQTPSGSVTTHFSIGMATDGTIQNISASTDSRDHEDAQYARRFSSAATKSLVGKKLADLTSLSAIGGASLTTDAFVSVIR